MALKIFQRLCCSGGRRWRLHGARSSRFPLGKVILVSSVLFVNQFGSAMIFPFLPFMVSDFFPELEKDELGKKAGYLGSAYFLGNFLGSLFWGWASDIAGRRPVMLLGLCGTITFELIFGLSQNFGWAVATRFMWGLLNGNVGIGKTYISEICDEANQAQGFSTIATGAGLGRLIGSVVGGFLAQPASKYSVFQTPFFCKFPYLLPCLVGVAIGIMALIAAFLFLDETLHSKNRRDSDYTESQPSNDSGIELLRPATGETDEYGGADGEDSDVVSSLLVMESDVDSESDPGALLFEDESATSDTELLTNAGRERKRGMGQLRVWAESWKPAVVLRRTRHRASACYSRCGGWVTACLNCTPRQARLWVAVKGKKLLRNLLAMAKMVIDRTVIVSISLYALMGLSTVLYDEMFPLLMVNDHSGGGYNLDSNEIGLILMCCGTLQLLWQFLIFPRLVNWTKYRRMYQICVAAFVIGCIALPFSNQITGPIRGGSTLGSDHASQGVSGFGSSSGWEQNQTVFGHVDPELNGTAANSTDYCDSSGQEYVVGVNDNSIERVPFAIWSVLISINLLIFLSKMGALTSVMVLIGNSTVSSTRGTINGISQSMVAFARSIAPLVGGIVFAWSEGNGLGWPLNYHLTFDVTALLGVVIILISFLLPKSSEKKRAEVEPDEATVSLPEPA